MDNQVTNSMEKMFSVNIVTFAFSKPFFCNDSLENVAGTDAF